MIFFPFIIELENVKTGEIEKIAFTSFAEGYKDAWQEATEEAWTRLILHEKCWLIRSITSCPA